MILSLQTAFPCVWLQYAMRLKAEMIFLNIAKGTTDPSVEFSFAKVTFLGHINFKISTEHQILMSTDCPYLIFVIFFTLAKFLESKIYTEKRQFYALNL